jgi:hypothetical protein
MSEEKRPVLSLKRKPAAETAATGSGHAWCGTPKKVVVVSTPPAWKVKKKLAAKQAAEAAASQPAPVMAKA